MHEEYQEKGVTYIRINKTKARVKYNEGKTIYLIQDMMRLPNVWKSLVQSIKMGYRPLVVSLMTM